MPFKPGQSGNPGGQHRSSVEFKELARSYSLEALDRLKAIALNPKMPPAVRMQADIYIIERAHGKPDQHTTSEVTTLQMPITDEQKAEAIHSLAERVRVVQTLQ